MLIFFILTKNSTKVLQARGPYSLSQKNFLLFFCFGVVLNQLGMGIRS